ncbi:hypothetical protein C5167_017517, partial [Papaver somniferum]
FLLFACTDLWSLFSVFLRVATSSFFSIFCVGVSYTGCLYNFPQSVPIVSPCFSFVLLRLPITSDSSPALVLFFSINLVYLLIRRWSLRLYFYKSILIYVI